MVVPTPRPSSADAGPSAPSPAAGPGAAAAPGTPCPAVFSVLFGVNACGSVALSQVNSPLLDRYAPRTLLVAALVLQRRPGRAVC